MPPKLSSPIGHRRSGARAELDELDEPAYEHELAHLSGATAFHRWFFLEALAAGLDLRLRAFAVSEGGAPIGVVPVLLRRRGLVNAANHLQIPHLGPLCEKGHFGQMIDTTGSMLAHEHVVMTRWAFGPRAEVDRDALSERGFWVYDEPTLVLHARPPEETWRALSPKMRASIRRTQNRGAVGGPSTHEEIVGRFPELIVEPYIRQGIAPPYSVEALRVIAERLADHPDVWWWSVRMDGELVTISNLIVHGGRAYGWLLGGGPRLPGVSPHAVAYWDTLQRCAACGLELDAGGAPSEGVGQLKLRFGAEFEDACSALRVRPRLFATVGDLRQRLTHH